MNINEIVGRLKAGGLDASSTNRGAAVYVTEARSGRSEPGWFGFRIVCDSEATERRVRAILSRWYDIDASGNVWRLKSKNRVPLMAIKRGVVPPTPPTPTDGPMYFEAAEANSTVSMVSTLTTAPELEYSTDGEIWQEWQHTTAEGTHTFDTLTLTAVGDKVYLRGDNPNGISEDIQGPPPRVSAFVFDGLIDSGGNIMSLIDKTMSTTIVPDFGLACIFTVYISPDTNDHALRTPPSMEGITEIGTSSCAMMFAGQKGLLTPANMPNLTKVGDFGCGVMYSSCSSLTLAANIPAVTTVGDGGFDKMYEDCAFNMSDDGTTLNFDFPTPPITAGEETYSTAYDLAEWMGNTNGFTQP